jgi:riboflavin biosynthesis pyrimidine reductase
MLNINSLLIEGGNYLHKYFTANAIYDKFYWFKSMNDITSGIKFSDEVINSLQNNYKLINKISS